VHTGDDDDGKLRDDGIVSDPEMVSVGAGAVIAGGTA
jgi:hypothetical protein